MTLPRRHWFRFSLRTLFVVVTVLACWLGYQWRTIHERRQVRVLIEGFGGRILAGDDYKAGANEWQRFMPESEKLTYEIPWIRQVMGDIPAVIVEAPVDKLSERELDRVRRAFPEAFIAPVMADQPVAPMPHGAEEPDWRDEVNEALAKPLESGNTTSPAPQVDRPE